MLRLKLNYIQFRLYSDSSPVMVASPFYSVVAWFVPSIYFLYFYAFSISVIHIYYQSLERNTTYTTQLFTTFPWGTPFPRILLLLYQPAKIPSYQLRQILPPDSLCPSVKTHKQNIHLANKQLFILKQYQFIQSMSRNPSCEKESVRCELVCCAELQKGLGMWSFF